jgi:hypothetical protein
MSAKRVAWFDLPMDTALLLLEAQSVIALRVAKAATGALAVQEVNLMVAEKGWAVWDTQWLVVRSLMEGRAHLAPARALALYRRRVQANQRRLSRSG